MRAAIRILMIFGFASLLGAAMCGSHAIVRNAGFDMWCGESLCSWTLEAGAVRRVPTWQESDYGVELIGSDVRLSQVVTERVECLRFDLIADVEARTTVTLELDFGDDGTTEHVERIPASDWQPLSFFLTMPGFYERVRLRLVKIGDGHAVIAQVFADSAGGCSGPPIEVHDTAAGLPCLSGSECAGGYCAPSVVLAQLGFERSLCAACLTSADCGEGLVCSIESSGAQALLPSQACGAAAQHVLGELCLGDDDCSTGVCCANRCSECCPVRAECVGEVCEVAPDLEASSGGSPHQCAPGQSQRTAGESCLRDIDCQANRCQGDGEVRVCQGDGRRCAADSDCGYGYFSPFAAPCVTLGQRAGICQ